MSEKISIASVRVLPEDVVNKIAAGEVIERPASVVKELVENALDALATRIVIRLVAAGRRSIEVVDNGHGMSEQDALLSIERHATSKIRKADDLEMALTLGFRGEALPSIAAVSRFELATRRAKDESATRVRIEGGILRDVSHVAAPAGTRVTANHLYFNTPVRAKFLKGITTELSQCIDVVQRHALAAAKVGFQLYHNDKLLLDIPDNASLRERVALIWGLSFLNDLMELQGEQAAIRLSGLIGTPALSRSQRSHQFFFLNGRPVTNRSLLYGFEDAYRQLLTIGRHPVGIVMLDTHPRLADVNIHPAKREVRFRDERAARDAVRDIVRERLASFKGLDQDERFPETSPSGRNDSISQSAPVELAVRRSSESEPAQEVSTATETERPEQTDIILPNRPQQTDFMKSEPSQTAAPPTPEPNLIAPSALYMQVGRLPDAPLQLFDTYLLVPEEDRLLIIDQHALHERLTYDSLLADLEDNAYEAQRLLAPLVIELPPSHVKLVETNLAVFSKVGIELETFGPNTFQVTAICHLYDDAKVPDIVYRIVDELAQGELFKREDFLSDLLRLAVEACRGSIKAGDRLTQEERRDLIDGFRRLRPPYTCPHGRPIITELTQMQMEKSFRRRQ